MKCYVKEIYHFFVGFNGNAKVVFGKHFADFSFLIFSIFCGVWSRTAELSSL